MYCFVFTNAIPLVKSDDYIYIQNLLIPWKNSALTFSSFWSHPHPQPLTALLFLLNARFFDLQMNYTALVAALFAPVLFWIVYRAIQSTLDDTASDLERNLLVIALASVIFSLSSMSVLTWSLVTLFYAGISMSVLCVYFLDKLISGDSKRHLVLMTAGLCLLAITFSGVARIYLYSAIVVIFLRSVIQRKPGGLSILVPLLLALFFNHLFFQWLGKGVVNEGRILRTFEQNAQYLFRYMEFVGVGLLSPWLNIDAVIGSSVTVRAFTIRCGLATLLLYLATFGLYLFSELSRKTILPGVLIIAALLTAVGSAVYRFEPALHSPMAANVPRYYLHYMVGIVGVVWVWWYFLAGVRKYHLGRAAIILIFSAIVYSQYLSSAWAHAKAPGFRKKIQDYSAIMIANANGDLSQELPWYMVGGHYPGSYLRGLAFLKEHRLNLFRDSITAGEAGEAFSTPD